MPYQLLRHPGHLEVRLAGALERFPLLEPADRVHLRAARRVLVDVTSVTTVDVDVYWIADVARRQEAAGIRLAICAPRPALFGIARQALQLAGVREGTTASVFSSCDAAREWLISD